jgi:hypothetical protein
LKRRFPLDPQKPSWLRAHGEQRVITINSKRIWAEERRIANLLYPERLYWRPRVRADCKHSGRPCPYVGCRYHLYLDVTKAGIRFNFPEYEVWDLPLSCALDVAEAEPTTLDEIAIACNLTRERVRQIQDKALEKLRGAPETHDLMEVAHELEEIRPEHPLRGDDEENRD